MATSQQATDFVVIVPAAGIGKRMNAAIPKQYLTIAGRTIIEHTVLRLLSHPQISMAIIAISENDDYFSQTVLADHPKVRTVLGGQERAYSVLAGLTQLDKTRFPWVLVHDAARPCVTLQDISCLINTCIEQNTGGILAAPVRDTMKRTNSSLLITDTVERELLWHALTPQFYPSQQLFDSLTNALAHNVVVTDEASTIEYAGYNSIVVNGRSDNIKITQPEDLALAEFILNNQSQSKIQ